MIVTRREGGVAVVSLNRPESRNAMTPEMFVDLGRGLDALRARAGARALLLTGEGRVFCGGFDLKLCLAKPGSLAQLLKDLSEAVGRLASLDIPVVIAAQGAAIAGGCALLSAADVVVTNDGARLGYPVTPLGVSPAVSAPFMHGAVGEGGTRSRQLDPDLISGRDAVRIGLAHESVSTPEEVQPRALAVARELAAKPPGAIAETKALLRELVRRADRTAQAERALRASLSLTDGAEERELLTRFLGAGRGGA